MTDTPSHRDFTGASVRFRLGLLTEDELAAALGLKNANTLATWRSAKYGPPHVKLGKSVFYLQADVDRWVNSQSIDRESA